MSLKQPWEASLANGQKMFLGNGPGQREATQKTAMLEKEGVVALGVQLVHLSIGDQVRIKSRLER